MEIVYDFLIEAIRMNYQIVGMIIAIHGEISDEGLSILLDSANLITGSTKNIEALNLVYRDDVQVLKEKGTRNG